MIKIASDSLSEGSKFPEVELKTFDAGELEKKGASDLNPVSVNTKDFFASKTMAVFTITGAFTPVAYSAYNETNTKYFIMHSETAAWI